MVVDLARYRCPDVDARDRAIFAEAIAAPEPKAVADGRKAVTKLQTQRWITALDTGIADRNAAGVRILAARDQCAGDQGKSS